MCHEAGDLELRISLCSESEALEEGVKVREPRGNYSVTG